MTFYGFMFEVAKRMVCLNALALGTIHGLSLANEHDLNLWTNSQV
jgi:hypothetical protein